MGLWRKEAKQPIERNYVSELDRFLLEFDKKAEASSDSRKAEEATYRRIDLLRDNETAVDLPAKLWKEF